MNSKIGKKLKYWSSYWTKMTRKSFRNSASKSTTNPFTSHTKMPLRSFCSKVTQNMKQFKRIPRLTSTFYVPKKPSKNQSIKNSAKAGSSMTLAQEAPKRKSLTYPTLSTTPNKYKVSEENSSQEISFQNKL